MLIYIVRKSMLIYIIQSYDIIVTLIRRILLLDISLDN